MTAAATVLFAASTIIGCTMIIPPREAGPASATGPAPAAMHSEPNVSVGASISVQVLRVLSGDTIEVELHGQPVLIHYLFTDSPSPGEELYNEATKLNQLLVGNADVLLVAGDIDQDEDGRLRRYVLTDDGLLVNEHMIAEGMARYEPKSDTSLHHAAMAEAEMAAMELGIGVWR
ncbi:MAG: thermonuclease family protein [Caldilineaceae bacterium]|nr:thermonuclease family protein [Caldilineaceae bacterium]